MVELQLSLPYPPSVNDYWLALPTGQVVPSKAAKAYKAGVGDLLAGRQPLFGRVTITRLSLFPPRASCDIDGALKCLFDALNGRLWLDDNQVKRITDLEVLGHVARSEARIEVAMEAERNCFLAEVLADAQRRAATEQKRKATLAENRRKATLVQPEGESPQQRLNRLARPSYVPAVRR